MLRSLIRNPSVTPSAERPGPAGRRHEEDVLVEFWPEGVFYFEFCITVLDRVLEEQSLEAIELSPQAINLRSWQSFREITFPLMLPVSITAVVLRIIFELKLADIVINVTAGGPGGATDTVSSFIFREYRDRSNVGYGTMLAEVYLVIIIVFVALLLKAVSRWMQKGA